MYDSNSKGISYSAGFFILFGFTLVALLIASLLSIPVWTAMTGKGFKDMETSLTNPAFSNAFRVIQSITAVVGFLFPALLTAFLLNRKPLTLIGFSREIKWKQVGLVLLIMIVALFVSGFFSYVNEKIPIGEYWQLKFEKMESDYNSQVESIMGLNSAWDYIVSLIVIAFLPAMCEEVLFRGGLQNFLTRSTKKPWFAIIVVSILFSLAHFSYYGFLSRIFLGMLLGLLYYYSGKIWLNILAHFFNNALAISALYYYKMQGKTLHEAMNDNSSSYWGIFILPLLIALLILFKKMVSSKLKSPTVIFEDKQQNPSDGF